MRGEFPFFVFERSRDIELEAGFILAGSLVIDEPKPVKGEHPPEQVTEAANAIIQKLTEMAQSALLPDDAIIYGWRDGLKPVNAVDNDELIAAWAKERICIAVRIDLRTDGHLRLGFIPTKNRESRAERKQHRRGQPASKLGAAFTNPAPHAVNPAVLFVQIRLRTAGKMLPQRFHRTRPA